MEKHTSYLNLSYAKLFTLTIPPSPLGTTLAALQGHTGLLLQLYAMCVQMNGMGESLASSQGRRWLW